MHLLQLPHFLLTHVNAHYSHIITNCNEIPKTKFWSTNVAVMSLQDASVSGNGLGGGAWTHKQTGCMQAINCFSTTVQFSHQCSLLNTWNQKLCIKIHIQWTPKARKTFIWAWEEINIILIAVGYQTVNFLQRKTLYPTDICCHDLSMDSTIVLTCV